MPINEVMNNRVRLVRHLDKCQGWDKTMLEGKFSAIRVNLRVIKNDWSRHELCRRYLITPTCFRYKMTIYRILLLQKVNTSKTLHAA